VKGKIYKGKEKGGKFLTVFKTKKNQKIRTNKLTNKQQETTSLYYQRNNPYHSSNLKPSKASFCIRTLYMFLKSCYDHMTVRKESSKISANYLRYLAKKWIYGQCAAVHVPVFPF